MRIEYENMTNRTNVRGKKVDSQRKKTSDLLEIEKLSVL